jgi:hypothetical protein
VFNYQIVELPKIDVCISGPLTIYDKNNPLTETLDSDGNFTKSIFVTSILNIFPIEDKTLVFMAQHPNYLCNWSSDLINKFSNQKKSNYKKIISDLITTRFEFWCISPKLYESIKREKVKELLEIWESEVLNHDFNINHNFNFFE